MKEQFILDGCYSGVDMYKVVAHIRQNSTGTVVQHDTSVYLYEDGKPSAFNWEENNYSCDCNRELFFYEGMGLEDPDNACTHGRYSVNLSNPATGKYFYKEYEDN